MSLDTIERVKYFCLRNVRSCGFCRLRNGRSSTRQSRRQDPELLRLFLGGHIVKYMIVRGYHNVRVRVKN